MRFPYSIFRRTGKDKSRPVYYIQLWLPDRRQYLTAKSAAVVAERLGLDLGAFSPFRKAGARLIAEAQLKVYSNASLDRPEKEKRSLGDSLREFWD